MWPSKIPRCLNSLKEIVEIERLIENHHAPFEGNGDAGGEDDPQKVVTQRYRIVIRSEVKG
jgi:hypothetical protein